MIGVLLYTCIQSHFIALLLYPNDKKPTVCNQFQFTKESTYSTTTKRFTESTVYLEIFVIFEYKEGKEFFTNSEIYLFDSKPYKPNNWNHGYVYYMAKNERLKKLLLVTEVWQNLL